MNLFEIAAEYRHALATLEQLDLPQEAIDDTLEGLQGEFNDKAIAVAGYVKNVEAEAAAIKAAIADMTARRKATEARAAHMKQWLADGMIEAGVTKVFDPRFSISARENGSVSVEIVNETEVPDDFTELVTPPPVRKIRKAEINKAGGCPGARIVKKHTVVIK